MAGNIIFGTAAQIANGQKPVYSDQNLSTQGIAVTAAISPAQSGIPSTNPPSTGDTPIPKATGGFADCCPPLRK